MSPQKNIITESSSNNSICCELRHGILEGSDLIQSHNYRCILISIYCNVVVSKSITNNW